MKIDVDNASLVNAITWVVKSMDSKDPNAFVVLETTDEGHGFLSYSNSSTYMRAKFEITNDHESDSLKVALNGPFLNSLVKALGNSGDTTELRMPEGKKSTSMKVKSTYGRFSVPVLNSQLPKQPTVVKLGEVNDAEYFGYLLRLSKLCEPSEEGAMPAIAAVDLCFDSEEKEITMMATDRYCLGEIVLEFTPSSDFSKAELEEDQHFLIPHYESSLISPTRGSADTVDVIYEASSGKFGYRFIDGREALFSPTDATPIPYQNIQEGMLKSVSHGLIVEKAELQKAISILSSMSWDDDSVHWTINSEKGFIVRDEHDQNKIKINTSMLTIDEDAKDEKFDIVFIREIIDEAFSPVTTKNVQIKWGERGITMVPILDNGELSENVSVLAMAKQ